MYATGLKPSKPVYHEVCLPFARCLASRFSHDFLPTVVALLCSLFGADFPNRQPVPPVAHRRPPGGTLDTSPGSGMVYVLSLS